MNRKTKWLWRALLTWIVAVTVAFIFAWNANQNRINDIQNSRKDSCERTYEGIREVFKPFLKPRPSQVRTSKEKHDIKLFNNTIDKLKSRCAAQTKAGA